MLLEASRPTAPIGSHNFLILSLSAHVTKKFTFPPEVMLGVDLPVLTVGALIAAALHSRHVLHGVDSPCDDNTDCVRNPRWSF